MQTEQMSISLSPQMARFIRNKVEAGEYADASEVVQDALGRILADDETANSSLAEAVSGPDLDAIRSRVQAGVQELESGDFTEYDDQGLRELFADVIERGKKRIALK